MITVIDKNNNKYNMDIYIDVQYKANFIKYKFKKSTNSKLSFSTDNKIKREKIPYTYIIRGKTIIVALTMRLKNKLILSRCKVQIE